MRYVYLLLDESGREREKEKGRVVVVGRLNQFAVWFNNATAMFTVLQAFFPHKITR